MKNLYGFDIILNNKTMSYDLFKIFMDKYRYTKGGGEGIGKYESEDLTLVKLVCSKRNLKRCRLSLLLMQRSEFIFIEGETRL
ncbi:hypothetical protein FACS189490_11420 [Clostridia bacterium]|nr:hypothetical protein FACS189490_11420 [Clostridia bacterium]